jgi:hypothetical protein
MTLSLSRVFDLIGVFLTFLGAIVSFGLGGTCGLGEAEITCFSDSEGVSRLFGVVEFDLFCLDAGVTGSVWQPICLVLFFFNAAAYEMLGCWVL